MGTGGRVKTHCASKAPALPHLGVRALKSLRYFKSSLGTIIFLNIFNGLNSGCGSLESSLSSG